MHNCFYVTEQFVEKGESQLGRPDKLIFDESICVMMDEVLEENNCPYTPCWAEAMEV